MSLFFIFVRWHLQKISLQLLWSSSSRRSVYYVGQYSGTEFRQHSWNMVAKLDAEKVEISWNWSSMN